MIEVFFCLVRRLAIYFIVFVYSTKFYVFEFLLCFLHFFPTLSQFFFMLLLQRSSLNILCPHISFFLFPWAAATLSLSLSLSLSQLQSNKLKEKGCELKKSFTNHLNQKHKSEIRKTKGIKLLRLTDSCCHHHQSQTLRLLHGQVTFVIFGIEKSN